MTNRLFGQISTDIEKEIDLSADNNTVINNLFTVTGTVRINSIVGICEDALTGTNENIFLDVFSANGSDVISKIRHWILVKLLQARQCSGSIRQIRY